jgi:hypothetical protein
MLLKDLSEVLKDLGTSGFENVGVYASEINKNSLKKVCGAKLVKSYADNGELVEWLEIQYTNI